MSWPVGATATQHPYALTTRRQALVFQEDLKQHTLHYMHDKAGKSSARAGYLYTPCLRIPCNRYSAWLQMWQLQEQELASGMHAKSLQWSVPLNQARHCALTCVQPHPDLTPASLLHLSAMAHAQQLRQQARAPVHNACQLLVSLLWTSLHQVGVRAHEAPRRRCGVQVSLGPAREGCWFHSPLGCLLGPDRRDPWGPSSLPGLWTHLGHLALSDPNHTAQCMATCEDGGCRAACSAPVTALTLMSAAPSTRCWCAAKCSALGLPSLDVEQTRAERTSAAQG